MNKKILILIISIIVIVIGIVFIIYNKNKDNNLNSNHVTEDVNDNSQTEIDVTNDSSDDSNEDNDEVIRIKLSFNNTEVYVRLNDSETSKDFINMLPLTLTFEDYNSTEKISILPRQLTTANAPSGYTPAIGDFAYYAPWGNLSLFYKEFRYSNSLIKLGEFESGIDKIQNLNEDIEITIEIVK